MRPDRWRAELVRYAAGVHELGEPALPAAIDAASRRCGFVLPPSFRDFLAAHDGATLFHAAHGIRCCLELTSAGFGWEGEETLAFDPARAAEDGEMPVVRFEPGAGMRLTVGSRFDRWLTGVLLREELVYDADGEFLDVFEERSPELRLDVMRKREERTVRIDPDAPSAHFELGRLHAQEGRLARAIERIEIAVALDPEFPWAHFELGRLRHAMGRPAEAIEAFQKAAALDPEQAPVAYAWAARIAAERGDERGAARLRARVRLTDPSFAERHKKLGQKLLEIGEAGAFDLLELGQAIEPDAETAALLAARPRR